jgi:hypothetical protein
MMRFVSDLRVPLPRAFQMAGEFALNSSLRAAFEDADNLDLARINALVEEVGSEKVPLDNATLGFTVKKALKRLAQQLSENPNDLEAVKKLDDAVQMARKLPFEVNLWSPQNDYYDVLQKVFPKRVQEAADGDATAKKWVERFMTLGNNLSIKVDQPDLQPSELQQAS